MRANGRRFFTVPLARSKSSTSIRWVGESTKYIWSASGLQPRPLEMSSSDRTEVTVPSASMRYRVPAALIASKAIVPAHSRPAGSQAASFIRRSGRSPSTEAKRLSPAPSASAR